MAERQRGFLVLRAFGPGAGALFAHEPGGHRWQRIPPNDRHGRVQTSTVTVAVLREPAEHELRIAERDLDWKTARGSGPGGQSRNKTESAVILTHVPTGLVVRCESERSQHQNRMTALAVLRSRLAEAQRSAAGAARNGDRREQIGSGQRGDKVRTIRIRDGVVTDHRTGRRGQVERYLRGDLDWLTE